MVTGRLPARLGALGAVLAAAMLGAPGASAAPTPINVLGGLTPQQARAATAATTTVSDCSLKGVVCKPALSGSCQGYTSQTTPPPSIKVLVRTSATTATITPVNFETYVENVLPNEWPASWDGDALKAGAVAVKSYAWYWVTHYGGYVGKPSPTTCFDVTDDTSFQVYRAGSATARTNAAVQESWPVVARVNGQVLQTGYNGYLKSPTETCGTNATGYTLSQWGSQNCVEENTGNKYNVILQDYYSGVQLATPQQQRTAHDFTFEQTSTRVTFANGQWSLDDGYGTTFNFGQPGDIPVITDSGDGFAHIGVWRPSTGQWYLAGPTGQIAKILQWGVSGDIPIPGHYWGLSNPSVPTVYRPSTQVWYFYGARGYRWGQPGDIPVPGDYNGDGMTDAAIFRPATGQWWIRSQGTITFGMKGDIPVPGDYNGDGKTDIAVYRPSNHTWYIRGMASVTWGLAGDIPVPGDYNGDGKTDIAVYRPSNHVWYTYGQHGPVFGTAGVTPIGAAPYSQ